MLYLKQSGSHFFAMPDFLNSDNVTHFFPSEFGSRTTYGAIFSTLMHFAS